jgi:hypothetical protein
MLSPKATNRIPPSAAGGGRSFSLGGTGGGSWETLAAMVVAAALVGAVGVVVHADVNATINAVKNDNVPVVRLAVRTALTQTINS